MMEGQSKLKLNYKRTMLIGFAFFGILLLWQVYDSWCPTFLTELFTKAIYPNYAELEGAALDRAQRSVQYIVGIIMAIDNLAALILLPIFGTLSDKTHTKIGKRMPYILVGTAACAIAFPFIPVFFHFNNIVGVIIMMAIVVIFAMMYRNPAVALMPDITPKPLRSKANGIINIMGYIGASFSILVGFVFVLSQYLGTEVDADGNLKPFTWQYQNIWSIELPFLIASVLMLVSALVLFFTVKENKVNEEMKEQMEQGEKESQSIDKVSEDKPLTKANLIMLILILVAEFFWFMADNGINTFMGNYAIYFLKTSTRSHFLNTLIFGIGSVAGFALGGIIAEKIGRKFSVVIGLGLSGLAYISWAILTFTVSFKVGQFPFWIFIIFFFRGFGMSLVHVNSFPMVVELCPGSKIGRFTGLYYASSMAAQTITPVALGALLLIDGFGWQFLPVYASICGIISLIFFMFVKNVKTTKTSFKKGLEALDTDD